MPERNSRLAAVLAPDGRLRDEIAAAAGVNASLLSGLVTGRERPSPAVRSRVADALGMSESDLLPEVGAVADREAVV